MNKTKLMRYPVMITILGAIVMVLMFFLPYVSATEKYETWLISHKDAMYMEEINMTNADAVNISLFEFEKIYIETARQGFHEETSIADVIVISIFAGCTLLTLLMTLIRKPIGILVFDLLTMVAFKLICFDFEDRGVMPGSTYNWGVVYYLAYVVGMIIFAGAIWLLVEKRKAKITAKTEQNVMV